MKQSAAQWSFTILCSTHAMRTVRIHWLIDFLQLYKLPLQTRMLLRFFQKIKLTLNSHAITKTVSCISRQEIERFVLNYKKEKTLTTKTVALQCNDLCATMSQRVMYEWKNNRIWLGQMKKGLDPSFRIWENVHTKIWCAQYVIFFCVCKLPFDSV